MGLNMKICQRSISTFIVYNVLRLCQIVLFVTHNVITEDTSKDGYLLLQCIRHYLEVDAYAALEVHTEETLAASRKALLKFWSIMTVSGCLIE
jgi:hypothetical protein